MTISQHLQLAAKLVQKLPAEFPSLDAALNTGNTEGAEAAFVLSMRFSSPAVDYQRTQREQARKAARACQQAIECIMASPLAYLSYPRQVEEVKEGDALKSLIIGLRLMAGLCEKIAKAKLGRRPNVALWNLIRSKHEEFKKSNPGKKGFWKDATTGEWTGKFLERIEADLIRLGYPSSREALGKAMERALLPKNPAKK